MHSGRASVTSSMSSRQGPPQKATGKQRKDRSGNTSAAGNITRKGKKQFGKGLDAFRFGKDTLVVIDPVTNESRAPNALTKDLAQNIGATALGRRISVDRSVYQQSMTSGQLSPSATSVVCSHLIFTF